MNHLKTDLIISDRIEQDPIIPDQTKPGQPKPDQIRSNRVISNQIRPEMMLSDVMRDYPETESLFALHGLGELVNRDNLRAIAPYVSLETALQTHGISVEKFIELLEERTAFKTSDNTDKLGLASGEDGEKNDLSFMALMPCGLKVPFARGFSSFMSALETMGSEEVSFSVESNLNHELSYYPYVSHMESIDEMPDIVLSSDFNSFYHRRFYEKFVKPGHLMKIFSGRTSGLFDDAGITDPLNIYDVLCVNPLIIVADLKKLEERPLPRSWSDLLDPIWERSITLRGGENFFCHAVLLPIYKEHGAKAIDALARNILDGRHPSQMVKTAGSGKSAALYVMPDFFSKKIPSDKPVKRIWPEEGALASPVTMLVKRKKNAKIDAVIDYLKGEELAKVFAGASFPVRRADVESELPEGAKLKWLGWDYIRSNDLAEINKEIDSIFLPTALKGSGS